MLGIQIRISLKSHIRRHFLIELLCWRVFLKSRIQFKIQSNSHKAWPRLGYVMFHFTIVTFSLWKESQLFAVSAKPCSMKSMYTKLPTLIACLKFLYAIYICRFSYWCGHGIISVLNMLRALIFLDPRFLCSSLCAFLHLPDAFIQRY